MRFWAALLSAMLLLTIGSIWINSNYEDHAGSVGPVFLQPVERNGNATGMMLLDAHTPPTSSLVEASCTGNGLVEVHETITGDKIDGHTVSGHLKYQFVLPREGDYIVFNNGTGKVTCAFRFIKNYPPTKAVQDSLYASGSACALLLALVVWRWGK